MPVLLREALSMAENAVDLLHRVMTAYAEEGLPSIKTLIAEDDVIDASYKKLYANALQCLIANPQSIDRTNYMIWVAHNLERVGDRAANICERVFFIVTGERYQEIFQLQEFPSTE
jgi:phosphate transport system protein